MPETTNSNTLDFNERFEPFAIQMRKAGLEPIVIDTFKYYYGQLVQGHTGMIGESELEPVSELPDADKLSGYEQAGREALAKTVVLKLNGGLGTSMGLDKAKSLLVVKDGLTFLDIIARQVLDLRQKTGSPVPLILMNSFVTNQDSLNLLSRYPDLNIGIPLSFVQNKEPKVLQEGFQAVEGGENNEQAWCPPGHGDIYTALQTSGMLETLLSKGYEYVFVSNADNLGAVLDQNILGYFASEKLPFLMEVADRTEADSKGGHLARRKKDGRLILREVAQCPPEAMEAFSDIRRYSYFNTNSIWLHLPSLKKALEENNRVLKLPLIRNSKTLDPRDPNSPKVYQLETAMGAAIEVFAGSGAIRVPRTRFAPVKLCSDLLVLWSDAYVLTEDSRVVLNPGNRYGLPIVQLDSKFYKFVHDLQARFPQGAPSLTGCEAFKVEGDIRFSANVTVRKRVKVTNAGSSQVVVADGTVLDKDTVLG
ncbi:MAG TPA: UTP--glucose-1-phosphate uridylyltransferase [Chloroflexia bacterium]|nr:UTP--glucose-1-phosphate uridylyltransferase [Chloroflexia bacterium]